MNIRSQLLIAHTRANADVVQKYVEDNPQSLTELMACLNSNEVKVAQRASMVIGNFGRSNPDALQPWWEDLAEATNDPIHNAITRAVIRYFSELDRQLPKRLESRLVQRCVQAVLAPEEKTATSAFAMKFVTDRAAQYPEHAKRLNAALIRLIPSGSPGFQNRGRKMIEQLKDIL
jgi:HEAT repeat protein